MIAAKTYRGIDYDISALGDFNSLTCNAQKDENLAYNIGRVLFEHKDELGLGHQVARDFQDRRCNNKVASPFPSRDHKIFSGKVVENNLLNPFILDCLNTGFRVFRKISIDGLVKSHAANFRKFWPSIPKTWIPLSTRADITSGNRSLKT